MKNLVQASPSEDGTKKVEMTNNSGVAKVSGQMAFNGSLAGIYVKDVAIAGKEVALLEQIISYPVDSGISFAEGALVYWDESADKATSVSASNVTVGIAVEASIADADAIFKMLPQAIQN